MSVPSGGRSPRSVVTSAPSACTANIRHDRTASPSTSTVHAPHTPCSQPRCVPVSAQSSRRKSASVLRASTAPRCRSPLTVSSTALSHCAASSSASGTTALDQMRARYARAVARRRVHVVRGSAIATRAARAPRRRRVGAPCRPVRPRRSAARTGVDPMPNNPMAALPRSSSPSSTRRRRRRARSRRGGGRTPRPRTRTRPARPGSAPRRAARRRRTASSTCREEVGRREPGRVPPRAGELELGVEREATAGNSDAGSAWASDPPTVPRLRIWKWPMSGVAGASSGTRLGDLRRRARSRAGASWPRSQRAVRRGRRPRARRRG